MSEQSTHRDMSGHIELLDFVRGLAIIQVFIYHYFIEWYHGSFLIVPEGIMPNLQRLQIFQGGGVLDFLKNIFAFFFVYGFASVNLFLVLSGFVLTYSLLKSARSSELTLKYWLLFLWKRGKRILIPLYTATVIGIAILFLRNFLFPALSGAPVYNWLDFLKLFFVPFLVFDYKLLQLFNGDYWFIPLILQLYLLFPVLFWLLKKVGTAKFLAITLAITLLYRFLATYGYQLLLPYLNIPILDAAPMGVIYPSQYGYYGFGFFLPRLFEFGLGIGLAAWHVQSGKLFEKMLHWQVFFAGLLLTLLGFASNAFRFGWIFSDLLMAIGLFIVFLHIGQFFAKWQFLRKLLKVFSDSTYEIYLIHHYFLNYLLLPFLMVIGLHNESGFWLFLPVFFVVALLTGWLNTKLNKVLAKVNH